MTLQNLMGGNGKMRVGVMHILAVNLFMQESDNLAPDAVEGISSWYLAKQSLPVVFKAVHPAFEIPVFVFRQIVNPSASSLLFLS